MSTGIAWLWADRVIVKRIRDKIENPSTALVVYIALCELASEHRSPEFVAKEETIGAFCGLSSKTVRGGVCELESVKAIRVTRPPIKSPATFNLLNPLGNNSRSLGNNSLALGNPSSVIIPDRSVENGKKLPNPVKIRNKGGENTPRNLSTSDRIGLEKQSEALELEIRRLSPLRLHEQEEGHKERLELKRGQLAKIKDRLAEAMEAIT